MVKVFEWSRDSIRMKKGSDASGTVEQAGLKRGTSANATVEQAENDDQYVNFLFQFPAVFRAWCDQTYRLEGLVPNLLAPQKVMECLAYDSTQDQDKAVRTALFLWWSYPFLCMGVIILFVIILLMVWHPYKKFVTGSGKIEALLAEVSMSKVKTLQVTDMFSSSELKTMPFDSLQIKLGPEFAHRIKVAQVMHLAMSV